MRVAVTGAGGQTGGYVFRKMLARPEIFSPVGITRTVPSREVLLALTGCAPSQVVAIDVANGHRIIARLAAAFAGCAALVICTTAKVKPTGKTKPLLGFPDGQPYRVDWLGQRNQIDAAREAGVEHVVVCGSMGGTNPNHIVNNFGRSPDGLSGGGILLWKRRAEKYLIDSGLTYTIVHCGPLLNEPGGRRRLSVGVDDSLLPNQSHEAGSVPREDVAEVLVQSLLHEDYRNRSFDLVAEEPAEDEGGLPGAAAEPPASPLTSSSSTASPAAAGFAELLAPLRGADCDYGLPGDWALL